MSQRPTLKDVARLAKVSEMTASRVLRGKGEASAETRARVEAAAKQVAYVPNRIAGALSSNSVNLIGVVIPSVSSFVFSEVLTGIADGLAQSELQPVVGLSHYCPVTEEKVIREMLSWRPSGIIVAGLEHSETSRQMLNNAGIPVAEIMDTDGMAIDINVGISHTTAGYEMGREILRRGYRKIGFAGTKMPHDYRAAKRLSGFEQALAETDVRLTGRALYKGASTLAKGNELTAQLLEQYPHLDCIYYSSDLIACGGLMHCITHSISVPGDLSLAGFNGLDLRKGMPQLLATTNAYRYETGMKAAEMVVKARQATPPQIPPSV